MSYFVSCLNLYHDLFNRDHTEPYSLSKANIQTYFQFCFPQWIFHVCIKNTDYEDEKALKESKYKDRAGKRKEQIGSEGTFQRDDAPYICSLSKY